MNAANSMATTAGKGAKRRPVALPKRKAEAPEQTKAPDRTDGTTRPAIRIAPAAARDDALVEKVSELEGRVRKLLWQNHELKARLSEGAMAAGGDALEAFALDLIMVADCLRQGLDDMDAHMDAADAADPAAQQARAQQARAQRVRAQRVREGFALSERLLIAAFEKAGLRPIGAVGRPFDPTRHHAIEARADGDAPPGTVVAELRRGWAVGQRVLRSAWVAVAEAPPPVVHGSTGGPFGRLEASEIPDGW